MLLFLVKAISIAVLGDVPAEALPRASVAGGLKRAVAVSGAQGGAAGEEIGDFCPCLQPILEERLKHLKGVGIALGNALIPAVVIVVAAAKQPGADRIRPGDEARLSAAF